MKRILLLLCCALAVTGISGQPAGGPEPGTPWNLDTCIAYARRNNIGVRQSALQVEQQRTELSSARMSRLPDLNASVGVDLSLGRTLTGDNTYRSSNQTSGSLGISAGMPLFAGLRINRQIKASRLDLAAAVEELERLREDVGVQVMTLYLQTLYATAMVGVAERQLALSREQTLRSRELVAAGKQPESARYESEALEANDYLTLTQAQNDLRLALLELSQALNRPSAEGFDIAEPPTDSVTLAALHRAGSIDAVYDQACEERPHIRAERLRVESSRAAVGIARAALYPTVSLSAGYGTGIYDRDEQRFWQQFRNYSREYVGVSVSIPIFNRRATRNNIRTAQLSLQNRQLALTEAEQSLRKQIEQAWYNADAAYAKYRAAEAALASARTAFAYAEQKAAAGRSTLYDFNDAKTRMEKADAESVQARYEFLFRQKILDYYRGQPLGFADAAR